MNYHNLLDTAKEAAIFAGNILSKGFGGAFKIENKEGRHNLVTEYDRLSENSIIERISSEYPDHCFLAEESGATGFTKGRVRWIIDPLDGTVNFAHSIPIFCVSIAAEVDGELVCGVIYQPMLGELFTAVKGEGALMNDGRITVSSTSALLDSILVTGFPYNVSSNPDNCIDQFSAFLRLGIPIRRLGSAALDLAYTASGRFDGFWEARLNPWDVAAGILIAREAGGRVSDYRDEEYNLGKGQIVATNGCIHKDLLNVLSL